MTICYVSETTIWFTILAFIGIQLQGTLYNYYYVILRTFRRRQVNVIPSHKVPWPVYPSRHVQLKLPAVLLQSALMLQLFA